VVGSAVRFGSAVRGWLGGAGLVRRCGIGSEPGDGDGGAALRREKHGERSALAGYALGGDTAMMIF